MPASIQMNPGNIILSEKSRPRRSRLGWFHLCKIPRIDTFRETESISGCQRPGRRGLGKWLWNGYEASLWGDEMFWNKRVVPQHRECAQCYCIAHLRMVKMANFRWCVVSHVKKYFPRKDSLERSWSQRMGCTTQILLRRGHSLPCHQPASRMWGNIVPLQKVPRASKHKVMWSENFRRSTQPEPTDFRAGRRPEGP